MRTVHRGIMAGLAAIVVLLAGLVANGPTASAIPVPPPKCTDDHSLAFCVAYLAKQEYANVDGHKYEKPIATNCNYFSAVWHNSGATKCSNGWWSEEWCMDFSRWVYKTQGASVAKLNHLAYSAKDYSTYKTYASGRRPKVGDLAVWKSESHVGIVVAVSGSTATVVSGNSYNPAYPNGTEMQKYSAIWKASYAASTFQGFAAPHF